MSKFNRLVVAASLAVSAMAATSAAAADRTAPASPLTLDTVSTPVYAQQDSSAELRPLMSLLDRAGVAEPLTNARIDVYGHVEAGWTHSFDDPEGGLLLGRVFDIEHDDPTLHQVDLNIERKVDLDSDAFDIGGRVELLWGGDARFIHSNGILDDNDFFEGPDNQFDLVQAYVDFGLPVGNGLRLRVGKFLFFKQIDPNASVFYSHSYTFGAALPFTLSGVSGYYELSDQWGLELGVNRGWGQSLEDNNDSVSFHGRVTYRPTDRTSFSLLAITGPELEDEESNYRTVFNFVVRHEVSDELTFLLDSIWGYQPNVDEGDIAGGNFPGSVLGDNTWYGVAGYLVYELSEQVSLGGRLEWFHDEGGFTTGIDQNLYEATVGLTVTPFAGDEFGQNLKIRPEVRYDYSDNDYFDGLTSNSQFTFGIDAIFNF